MYRHRPAAVSATTPSVAHCHGRRSPPAARNSAAATRPGKKNGRKPKWRPARKYPRFAANVDSNSRAEAASTTISLVVMEIPRSSKAASGLSKGNRP